MTDSELRALALAAASDDACGVCHGEFRAACDPQTVLSLLDRLQAAERIPREPTGAMMKAGVEQSLRFTTLAPMYSTEIADLWRAMYDAAQGAQDTPGDA